MENFENEEWRVVDGFPMYKVSNLGRVYSRYNKGRMLSLSSLNADGYVHVKLYRNGTHSGVMVHRLVCLNFLLNPENKPEVNHKNGVKTDNALSNLEWATSMENVNHGIDTGLIKRLNGVSHYKAVLNDELVIKIREMARSGISFGQIGRMTNRCANTVALAATGKNWAHVNSRCPPVPPRGKMLYDQP